MLERYSVPYEERSRRFLILSVHDALIATLSLDISELGYHLPTRGINYSPTAVVVVAVLFLLHVSFALVTRRPGFLPDDSRAGGGRVLVNTYLAFVLLMTNAVTILGLVSSLTR